jgi:hypothetical protein
LYEGVRWNATGVEVDTLCGSLPGFKAVLRDRPRGAKCSCRILPRQKGSMKKFPLIAGSAMAFLLAGCASTPVVLAPVGPGPSALKTATSPNGSLVVYSAKVARSEGDNPAWFQHTDYYLEGAQKSERVDNTVGHYAQRPRTVHLAPGNYTVKAEADDGRWVTVPVVVQPGKTTIVSLDGSWNPAEGSGVAVVRMPDGSAVGWRSDLVVTGRVD